MADRTFHLSRRGARIAAVGWTLLILGACFLPGSEIPNIRIPLMDKWVHFVLFGVLAFLWLRAYPSRQFSRLVTVLLLCIAFGYGVEVLQGLLRPYLGRSYDGMDALADAVGSLLGTGFFFLLQSRKKAGAS